MRTLHAAAETIEIYSPAEERFNRRRRTVGLFAAPAIFLLLLLWPTPSLAGPIHRLTAVLGMVVVLWMTEALPLPVTALVGPVLAIVLEVAPARTVLAPFADPIIFLFMGSFMLAEAMFVHGLDRRIAFTALSRRAVGASPARILFVYAAVATVLSMWVSNTATTAMMFPIGLSIVAHLARSRGTDMRYFAMAMMLMTSYGASIGGIGTPIGTPPNLIGIGLLERVVGARISFFQWMLLALPIMVLLFGFLIAYFSLIGIRRTRIESTGMALVEEELRKLGPVSPGQRNVILAFGLTVLLWILPGVLTVIGADNSGFARVYAAAVPESVAALVGALLLFVLPIDWRTRRFTLSWDEAVRIDWGIILLFGGGLALGELAFTTGLAEAMGRGITSWLPVHSVFGFTILFTGLAILVSEAASNTAAANMIVPIAIAVSQAAGVSPLEPALGATLGASMGFMMPISTPPNAIVYSSGYIPITAMMRHGVVLDVAGFLIISAMVILLGPLVIR